MRYFSKIDELNFRVDVSKLFLILRKINIELSPSVGWFKIR